MPQKRTVKPPKSSLLESEPSAGIDPSDLISVQLAQRLRDLRAERNWSLETLSRVCGVSRSMLSQIERNEVNPTLQVTYSIAGAFGMSLGELLRLPGVASSMKVIRENDQAYHYRSDQNCRIRTLSPLHLEKDVEFYEVRLKRGGSLRSAAHYKGTREFLTVQRGRVRVKSGDDIEDLGEGDSVSYHADVHHSISNIGDEEAAFFLVDIYRNAP